MSNRGKVRPTDDGQTLELVSAIVNSLPREMTDDEKKFWSGKQGRNGLLAKKLREALGLTTVLNPILAAWATFYRDYLGLEVDLSSVVIPAHRPGYDRVLVIPRGLTMNQVIAAMKKHFSVSLYTNDLDRDVPTNERDSKTGAYAIRVRDRVEADEELKNLSANQIAEMKLATMTLLERLVYEFKYYSETKSHLDVTNITRCDGSRYSGGHVPYVRWHDSSLHVDWYFAVSSHDSLRSRRAAV